jgi:hypothetical protein
VDARLADDPWTKAGVWRDFEITPFKISENIPPREAVRTVARGDGAVACLYPAATIYETSTPSPRMFGQIGMDARSGRCHNRVQP